MAQAGRPASERTVIASRESAETPASGRGRHLPELDPQAMLVFAALARVVRTAVMLAAPLVAEGMLVPVLEPYWVRTPIHAVHAGSNPPPAKLRALLALLKDAVPRALA